MYKICEDCFEFKIKVEYYVSLLIYSNRRCWNSPTARHRKLCEFMRLTFHSMFSNRMKFTEKLLFDIFDLPIRIISWSLLLSSITDRYIHMIYSCRLSFHFSINSHPIRFAPRVRTFLYPSRVRSVHHWRVPLISGIYHYDVIQ